MRQIWWIVLGMTGCAGPLEGRWSGDIDCLHDDRSYVITYELDLVTDGSGVYTGDGEYDGIGTIGSDDLRVSGQIDDLVVTQPEKKGEQDLDVVGELSDCRQYVNDELAVSDCSEANFSAGWEWVWDGGDEIELDIAPAESVGQCRGELELEE